MMGPDPFRLEPSVSSFSGHVYMMIPAALAKNLPKDITPQLLIPRITECWAGPQALSEGHERIQWESARSLHELSLVQGIIDTVEEIADEKGRRVKIVKVGVGELASFDLRQVRRLLEDLRRGTPLEEASVTVEPEKSRIKCLNCGRLWGFEDLSGPLSPDEKEAMHFLPELLSSYAKCPSCSKSYFEIAEGRSVRIVEVVLDA
jgi:hydrogenase nickel incorporation protein HypA/HybF